MKRCLIFLSAGIFALLPAFGQINIKFEQYQLPNGLTVLIHEDHSTPIAAVVVMYHVGSKNEKPKRTGFAHLFEHMMFQGSAHVADDEHFKLLQEIGANINGSTNEDVTNYFEIVPSNYLELALYLESDRMGFLLPAMTQEKLDNQRDVVKNERRQGVDNVPYGTADEKIAKAMYPESHPYSWPVIGYMEDLSAAKMEDVQGFFRTYYAPNNAVLSIAGDVTPSEVKELVEKYFGPIPRGQDFERPKQVPVSISQDLSQTFEDKVQLPRLYLTWHSPANFTREDAALTVLADILSSGKSSRLFKTLVYDRQIAQTASASAPSSEIAGLFQISVTAKPGRNLAEIKSVVDSIMSDVLANGVTDKEVEFALTSIEAQIINRAATVFFKANSMANYYCQTGDPNNINKQWELYKGMTAAEVLAAAKKYLTQHSMSLSVVPLGKPELAAQKGE
ncbi:MAG TPA: pitrilysin family protein [Bacteroidota bacterium]|jgi:zinc protease|nr:pitrilysin family protein [Bacteroidota bacterium]